MAAGSLTFSVINIPITNANAPDNVARQQMCRALREVEQALGAGTVTSGNVTLDPAGPGLAAQVIGTWVYVAPT